MKRNIYLLSALAALSFFASCSDDDNNNNQPQQTVELYTSSNTSGKISVTNLSNGQVVSLGNADEINLDSDGIFYNPETDQIIQASRSRNKLNLYENVHNAMANGTTLTNIGNGVSDIHFTNPREIAVNGNTIFVVQDQSAANEMTNKIVVFNKNGDEFTKTKTYITDFKLWGIHVDGNNLYAVVDNTGDIVRFDNILNMPEGAIFPTKRVTIAGLTRTHGITYAPDVDIMVLTDVGSADNATDGGIVLIDGWNEIFNNATSGGSIVSGLQHRIYGPSTMLGNPVDVAYDSATNRIYVAERLNGGGRVLTFDAPMTGTFDSAPLQSRAEPGVSAVYLSRR
jgi:hypothetical protein